MKSLSKIIFIAALFAALATSCKKKNNDVAVTGVSLEPPTLSLVEGASAKLNATVSPPDATNKTVAWSSSNEAAATVDASGNVTAVKEGSAVITVKTASSAKTATCAVTVTAPVAATPTPNPALPADFVIEN